MGITTHNTKTKKRAKKQKRFLGIAVCFFVVLSAIFVPGWSGPKEVQAIQGNLNDLFLISAAPLPNTLPDHVNVPPEVEGNKISFPSTRVNDVVESGKMVVGAGGAATSRFTLDFSRSFKLEGKFKSSTADGVSFALHTNPNKTATGVSYATGMVEKPLNGVTAAKGYNYTIGSVATDSGMEKGLLWNTMFALADGYRGTAFYNGVYGYRMEGLNHNIFAPAAGDGYQQDGVPQNAESNFIFDFTCTNPAAGEGTLAVTIAGFTRTYNLNSAAGTAAGNIFGTDDFKNVYFTMSAWIPGGTGTTYSKEAYLAFDLMEYTDWPPTGNITYWADHDGDGVFDDQVGIAGQSGSNGKKLTLAIPGETIEVRNTLVSNTNQTNDIEVLFRIPKLADDLGNTYQGANVKDGETTVENIPAAYNNAADTVDPTKNMTMTLEKTGTDTVLSYQMTAPNTARTVTANFSIGQDPFTPAVLSDASYQTGVCKIGETVYETLQAALDDIAAGTATDIRGETGTGKTDYKIEMLVDQYDITAVHKIEGNKNINITTDILGDTTGKKCTLLRGFYADTAGATKIYTGTLFHVAEGSSLVLDNVTLNGNRGNYTAANHGQVKMPLVATVGSLTLGNGCVLENNYNQYGDDPIAPASPTATSASGGAVAVADGGTLNMEGAVIRGCWGAHGGAVAAFSGTNGTTVNLLEGAVLQNNTAWFRGSAIYCDKASGATAVTTLNLKGNVAITGNNIYSLASSEDARAAVVPGENDKINLEGKVLISNNTYEQDNSNTRGYNLRLGETNQVTVTGALTSDSNVGVTVVGTDNNNITRQERLGQFGVTQAAGASSVTGLSAFKNDFDSELYGMAGTGNQVIWGPYKVTISKTVKGELANNTEKTEAYDFTLQVTKADGTAAAGETIAIPDSTSTITLDSGGKKDIQITPGTNVSYYLPSGYKLTVTEKELSKINGKDPWLVQYEINDEGVKNKAATDPIVMDEDKTIAYTNTKSKVVLTGLNTDMGHLLLYVITGMIVLLTGAAVLGCMKKLKKFHY